MIYYYINVWYYKTMKITMLMLFLLKNPHTFEFREVDDLIRISLLEEDEGCQMVFTHIFDDKEMAMYIAAGWHRCLDALQQIVNRQPVEWKDNSAELRKLYREAFDRF
ncbi:SRPBCC family protein [Virgibacillus salexigens]|uniref:hypothetical protein n=2 Tax=Virgibacillus massiliensis TaxID=1462526 RepID=UPI0018E15369|nr:hypothetical protein [Virgibacillus massiliensis]